MVNLQLLLCFVIFFLLIMLGLVQMAMSQSHNINFPKMLGLMSCCFHCR